MKNADVKIKLLNEFSRMPLYATNGSAGVDLIANFGEDRVETIQAGSQVLIPTGISIELPYGYEAQIRSRSGLCAKHRLSVGQGVGTIDSDYRGEIMVLIKNEGAEPYEIYTGTRIAQMVVIPIPRIQFTILEDLDDTERGDGGFGSTGV